MATTVGTIPKPVRKDSSGVLRVGDTRVSLDSVVCAFNRGEDAAEIQQAYDSLSLAQVHSAIAYYLHNKNKVDAYLAKRETQREKDWREHEAQFPPQLTRKTLLSKRNGSNRK